VLFWLGLVGVKTQISKNPIWNKMFEQGGGWGFGGVGGVVELGVFLFWEGGGGRFFWVRRGGGGGGGVWLGVCGDNNTNIFLGGGGLEGLRLIGLGVVVGFWGVEGWRGVGGCLVFFSLQSKNNLGGGVCFFGLGQTHTLPTKKVGLWLGWGGLAGVGEWGWWGCSTTKKLFLCVGVGSGGVAGGLGVGGGKRRAFVDVRAPGHLGVFVRVGVVPCWRWGGRGWSYSCGWASGGDWSARAGGWGGGGGCWFGSGPGGG